MVTKKHIIIILAVLAAIILLLARLNAPPAEVASGTVAIIKNGQTLRTFTVAEIKELPCLEVEKEIVSAGNANESGLWRGVPLRALLNSVDKNLLYDAKQVLSRAEDAFTAGYSATEVALSDNILVVYAKDGVDLDAAKEGGGGPLRIVVQEDAFGYRSTKNLSVIELQ